MHGTHLYRVRMTSYTIHPLYMTTFTIHQTYPLTHFVFHPSCLLSSCPLPFHTMHITNSCIYILPYPLYPYILPLIPLIDTHSFTKSFFSHLTHYSSPIFSPLFITHESLFLCFPACGHPHPCAPIIFSVFHLFSSPYPSFILLYPSFIFLVSIKPYFDHHRLLYHTFSTLLSFPEYMKPRFANKQSCFGRNIG